MTAATRQRMRPLDRIGLVAVAASVALVLAACGTSTPTTASTPPSASGSPALSTATASTIPSGSAPLSTATASTSPVPSPTPSAAPTACPLEPQTGRLPSDRIVDVIISRAGSADLVTFVFGDPSLLAPPAGASKGSLDPAEPPFTNAASGLPIKVDGERVAQVRFSGMLLSNDVGQPTYDGPTDFRPDLPALRSVVAYDLFEGVSGWYIGYDGRGCVTLTSDSRSVTVAIQHPPG